MKKTAVLIVSLFVLQGCIPLLIGGAGVVTGFAISNDSASGTVKADYRELWDECLDTLEDIGAQIIQSNESKGQIQALASEYKVTIKIDSSGRNSQQLTVSARKTMMPKPHFAQKIFYKITDRLK